MSSKLIFLLLIILLLPAAIVCADDLIVIQGNSETMSRIDLESGVVTNDILELGLIPNHIACKNNKAYVVNSGSDDLYIIDLSADTVEAIIDLGSGRNPWASGFISDTTLLITNFISSTLSKVDIKNLAVIDEWLMPTRPQAILSDDTKTYITITGFNPSNLTYGQGQLLIWDNQGDSIIQIIDVGTNPQDVELGMSGYLFVTCSGDYDALPGFMYIIDTLTNAVVDSFQTSSSLFPPTDAVICQNGVGFLAAGGWITNGEVYTFDPLNMSLLHDQSDPLLTGVGVMAVVCATDSTIFSLNYSADNITEMDSAGQILRTFYVSDGPVYAALNSTEFICVDSDGDGFGDPDHPENDCPLDNCPWIFNEDQADSDQDNIGDVCDYICGDANSDQSINVSDAVFIINYVFVGGDAPDPIQSANVNCDESVNVSDAVYIINYVFVGGAPACDPNNDSSPDC